MGMNGLPQSDVIGIYSVERNGVWEIRDVGYGDCRV